MKLSTAAKGFALHFLTDGHSKSTVDLYAWALGLLARYLDDPPITEITNTQLREFLHFLRTNYRNPPLAPSSVENCWKAIRSFYRWAHDELGIKRVDDNLPRPRYTSPEIIPLTADEIKSLLKACDHTSQADTTNRMAYRMKRPTAARDRAIVLMLLDTGLRVSELARLRVSDVNLESGEVVVAPYGSGRKTKGRVVFLGRVARRALWKYVQDRAEGALFLTQTGRDMDRNSIRLLLTALGRRAGFRQSTNPHRFRHTFAIQYLRNGGDVFTLQRLLGHSSLEMVKKYLLLADADAAAAHRVASPADRWEL